MSFTEVLAEIPQMTSEQRREVARCVAEADAASQPRQDFRAEYIDGRLLLVGPRIVTQEEVEAILADFP